MVKVQIQYTVNTRYNEVLVIENWVRYKQYFVKRMDDFLPAHCNGKDEALKARLQARQIRYNKSLQYKHKFAFDACFKLKH